MLLLDENGNIQRVDDPPGRYDLPERQEDDRLYDLMVQNGTGTPMKCEKRLRATLKQRKKPGSARSASGRTARSLSGRRVRARKTRVETFKGGVSVRSISYSH